MPSRSGQRHATRQGGVLVAMGARWCVAWAAVSWRLSPARRLSDPPRAALTRVCTGQNEALPRRLARHPAAIALTLRDDRLGAWLVGPSSEEVIERLIRHRQAPASPVEALYSRLFVGRPWCKRSPPLVCTAASLEGAVVIEGNGLVRGLGGIFAPQGVPTPAGGARTRAARFASQDGVALQLRQDGERAIFGDGESRAPIGSPAW